MTHAFMPAVDTHIVEADDDDAMVAAALSDPETFGQLYDRYWTRVPPLPSDPCRNTGRRRRPYAAGLPQHLPWAGGVPKRPFRVRCMALPDSTERGDRCVPAQTASSAA